MKQKVSKIFLVPLTVEKMKHQNKVIFQRQIFRSKGRMSTPCNRPMFHWISLTQIALDLSMT